MNFTPYIILTIVLFTPHQISSFDLNKLIVWNVGQGQWVTYLKNDRCIHIDIGGEKMDWRKLKHECYGRKNFLYISHPDWDHVSKIKKARQILPNLCLRHKLTPQFNSTELQRSLRQLPYCTINDFGDRIKIVKPLFRRPEKQNKNARSFIFTINETVLIPGDSTKKAEARWIPHIFAPKKITTLILGHHGSNTSTSLHLLRSLPNLNRTITSARKRKYGHPHNAVVHRLNQFKLPLYQTEHWGHIIIELQPTPLPNSPP